MKDLISYREYSKDPHSKGEWLEDTLLPNGDTYGTKADT